MCDIEQFLADNVVVMNDMLRVCVFAPLWLETSNNNFYFIQNTIEE